MRIDLRIDLVHKMARELIKRLKHDVTWWESCQTVSERATERLKNLRSSEKIWKIAYNGEIIDESSEIFREKA